MKPRTYLSIAFEMRLPCSKSALDQVDLSYVVVDEESLAAEIKQKIETDTSFGQLTQIYPLDVEPQVLVKREINRREQLREEIRVAIETVAPKKLVGPIPMGNRWCVCRVEQVLPAVLDDATRQELREVLFDRWLAEKQQQLAVAPITDANSVSVETTTEAV